MNCLACADFHQGDLSVFPNTANVQCVANAATALAFRFLEVPILGSTVNQILMIGNGIYEKCKPEVPPYIEPEELPEEFQIMGQTLVIRELDPVESNFFPRCVKELPQMVNNLVEILQRRFREDRLSDGYLFTGQNRTVSFWREQNDEFYLFDSHGVNQQGIYDVYYPENNKARLFSTEHLDHLAHQLLVHSTAAFVGENRPRSPYNIHRIRFDLQSTAATAPTVIHEVTPVSQRVNDNAENVSTLDIRPISVNVGSTKKGGRPKKKLKILNLNGKKEHSVISLAVAPQSPKIIVHSNILIPANTVVEGEANKKEDPEVLDQAISVALRNDSCETEIIHEKRKRGRKPSDIPLEKRRKLYDQKYREKNAAVRTKAAKCYQLDNPEIHQKAVKTYNENNRNVHRQSSQIYQVAHPEVNKKAVRTYQKKNPEVNKQKTRRYRETHPGEHLTATLRSRKNPLIGEFSKNDDYAKIKRFELKNPSLLDDDNCYKCPHCKAPLFDEEKKRTKWCCGQNVNNVHDFEPLDANFYKKSLFLEHPRHYNDLFAFCATVTKWKHPQGLSFMKIQGRTYHKVHDLNMKNRSYPNQSYMYIDDGQARLMEASKYNYLKSDIIKEITYYLDRVNPYINYFKRLALEPSDKAHLIFECRTRRQAGPILGEQPQSREVAAVISTTDEPYDPRKICIWKNGENSRQLYAFHPLMEPFQYPLLYPRGEKGWHMGMLNKRGEKLSQLKYIRCLLLSCERFSALNRLSETWLVDMYCRIEEERLSFITRCQKRTPVNNGMRTATLAELKEVQNEINADETAVGEGVVAGKVYLPYTFTGGPRYMKIKYMNAMTVVERLGTPDYFLTFTANGQWPEIKASTHKSSRMGEPQVINRVFKLYLDQLLNDIRCGRWFGECLYLIYVIEFQMRGLPHAHIIFKVKNGPAQTTDVDKFIRADIPSENEANGELRRLVLKHMIHGPHCSRPRYGDKYPPCFDTTLKKCSKFFPKKATPLTFVDNSGFYNYKRDENNKALVRFGEGDTEIDDTWVVPYNAPLLLKYNCHVNLDKCSARRVVHYLFKYITKGEQLRRMSVEPNQVDEVEEYVTKRYIGATDAAWRILEFDTTGMEPSVIMLPVHTEGLQNVYFKQGDELNAAKTSTSMLILYFTRPINLLDELKNLTYVEFNEKFIIHSKRPSTKNVQIYSYADGKHFLTQRQRRKVVVRMYWIAPNRGEEYYLRILLTKFPARSYEDLYKLGGNNCKTFQEAARHVGLVNDDTEYREAIREAAQFMYGFRLRSFFALLITIGAKGKLIWEDLKDTICLDLLDRYPNNASKAHRQGLREIDRALRRHGTSIKKQGFEQIDDYTTELIRELTEYNTVDLKSFVNQWLPLLSHDQRTIFKYVESLHLTNVPTIFGSRSNIIFIDAPGGYGKSKLLEVIAADVRSKNEVVLCVASSGIAALNLPGGITAHSMFKLPLTVLKDSTDYWDIRAQSQRAELIKRSKLIIYDEAPMTSKYLIEMIDRSLKDLMRCELPFGGKIVIFSGDFRQVAPIVKNAISSSDVAAVSMKFSYIWQYVKVFRLTTPQRVTNNPQFSKFLLDVGDGSISSLSVGTDSRLTIPLLRQVEFVNDLNELIDFVFPADIIQDSDACATRALLSTLNHNVQIINATVMDRLQGDVVTLFSADYLDEDQKQLAAVITDEIMHQATDSGVPDHKLQLKVGALCLITRNLNFDDRLVNGSKVIVTSISKRIITVKRPNDPNNLQYAIPRINFKFKINQKCDFEMNRRQFPLQLAYSMSIHKSQGQTLDIVGVDLRSPCFTHGQLYVALSRVRSPNDMRILVNAENVINSVAYTHNIIIKDLVK